MPQRFDWRAWSLAGLFVLVFVLWCWGGLLWFGRQLGLLIPPTERLMRLVSQTATRVGVPVRGVWLLRSAYSLAFALPYTGDLLFTDRLLARHPDDEISAVCAHEIGHLSEPRLIVLGRVFLNLAWLLPWVFFKPVMHAFEFPGVFVIALLSFAILLGNRGISRRLEKRADKIAHLNEGESGAYARALVRLYEDNLIPAVLARRTRSHPDLYDRLLSLGAQPDFARPKPATSNAVAVFALLFLLALLVGAKLSQNYM